MKNSHEAAAAQLADARRNRRAGGRLSEAHRPANVDDALAIQRRVIELLGETTGGWKCSVPNGDRILVAPLPLSTIYHSSPCRIIPKGTVAQIEPEIAFTLKRDLPPRSLAYSEDEVRDAVVETRLVLELMSSRYADVDSVTYLESLADSFRHQGMFIGPLLPDAPEKHLETFRLRIEGPDGLLIDREVRHPNGHPLQPLHWLVNFLSSRGETLEAGKIITTGSYAGIIEVPLGVCLRFEYGSLGEFFVQFDQFL